MEPSLDSPSPAAAETHAERFIDRDLSDLAYVERILFEAGREDVPLLEQLRFLSIASDVLDEFVAVRLRRVAPGQLAQLHARLCDVRSRQLERATELREALEGLGLKVSVDLEAGASEELSTRFAAELLPALTPLAVDAEHPFPLIAHQQRALAVRLAGNGRHVIIPLPAALPDYLETPHGHWLPLDVAVRLCLPQLLLNESVAAAVCFRVLRQNDLAMSEGFDDLRAEVTRGLAARPRNPAACLELPAGTPQSLSEFLERGVFGSASAFVCTVSHPGGSRLRPLATLAAKLLPDTPRHEFEPARPRNLLALTRHGGDLFAAMRADDFILHWPYERFGVLIDLLWQAARDPAVLSIKQTLYRTDPAVVEPLLAAARAGKEVTAVLELEARDSERSNVELSHALENEGACVVYGIVGLKVHAKLLLIIRRESASLRTYACLGTGNFHSGNARAYSDLCLFTAEPAIGRDLGRLFNYVTGHLRNSGTSKLVTAPASLKDTVLEEIGREAANARAGRPSGIWLKLNSLLDHDVIDALYEASSAGVPVRAIVRRHCALRPGVPQLSENIVVTSIIGRYLEHARVLAFANGSNLPSGDARVFLSSADWMPRNFHERVEVMVPITAPPMRAMLLDYFLAANLRDERMSWQLDGTGAYHAPVAGGFCAQQHFAEKPFVVRL